MSLYPTVPVCIQLTDYELETPHLGVAPIYSVKPTPPPPYNPAVYPPPTVPLPFYEVEPPHCLPRYVALVGIHPMHQKMNMIQSQSLRNIEKNKGIEEKEENNAEDRESKILTKEVIVNKKDGKLGIKTAVIHKNIYIYQVKKGSGAAQAGLRMGDQIVKVNGTCVTGMSNDSVHSVLKNCPPCGIKLTIRTRRDHAAFKTLDSLKRTLNDL